MSAKPIPTAAHNANTISRFMSFSSAPGISARLPCPTDKIYPAASECNIPAQFNLQILLMGDPFASGGERKLRLPRTASQNEECQRARVAISLALRAQVMGVSCNDQEWKSLEIW